MMIQYPAIFNPTQTEVRTLSSTNVSQEYQLFISLPQTYTESNKTFPVLYVLDGNGMFPLVKPIIEQLQLAQLVPELIIVGIGYPTNTYMDTAALRGRDLTYIELTPEQKAVSGYPWYEETGGAPRFFSFIAQELVPYIDREFRTDPDERALAGFSLGGTFVVYAMFQQPGLFNRMIANSPVVEDFLDIENQYAQVHSVLPLKFILATESPSDDAETRQWVERRRQFVKVLDDRKYEGLKTRLHIFEGIDHVSVGAIGFTYALREIYQ
jgi:predicted alpha/beta superfamily hydrolase